ncbi:hypothetical protein [Poriferisphaera sp. WC338]|uniref:hypothetical protein n=1 Tax=Poriferisphaera sp. WC338 TaxID=3425129 RepID=UPI003D818893
MILFVCFIASSSELSARTVLLERQSAELRGNTWRLTADQNKIDLGKMFGDVTPREWARAKQLNLSVRLDDGGEDDDYVCRLILSGARWFDFKKDTKKISGGRPQHVGYELETLSTRIGTGPVDGVLLEVLEIPKGRQINVRLDGIQLLGADDRGDVSGAIVDRYGQYVGKHWPEKVSFDDDLERWDEWEVEWLKEMKPAGSFDRYGGLMMGQKFKATGYFQVKKDRRGYWWFVTPEGHRMFSVGINAVSLWTYTDVKDRETLFDWLPEDHDGFEAAQKGTELRLYTANLIRKYGEDWRNEWAERTVKRMQSWGINTVGAWSDQVVVDKKGLPYAYCMQVKFDQGWTKLAKVASDIPDPFEPDFKAYLEEAIPARIEKMKNDPWLLGYFLNNELHWHELTDEKLLGLLGSSLAGKAYVEELKEKYGEPGEWGKVWGMNVSDWQVPAEVKTEKLSDEGKRGLDDFRYMIAEKYFEIYSDVVRRIDSNHLLLGVRFLHAPSQQPHEEVYKAAGKYCDVLSENPYVNVLDQKYFRTRYRQSKKPMLLSEFHFGIAKSERQLGWGAAWTQTREQRVKALEGYVEDAMTMPSVVGVHWFMYLDAPVTGRHDGENGQYGFVDVVDTPYVELVETMREVSQRVEDLRKRK